MKYKGCVVEVRDKTLVLMTASCDFVEIPKNATGLVLPGMEIVYETRPKGFAVHKKWMAVAAMVMVLIMGSFLLMPPTSAMPVYMASIDINPSFNMFIDETGHVVEIQPMNTEAKNLKTRNLTGKAIEEAVASLMEQLFEQGYFADKTEHYMVFSLSAIDASIAEAKVGDMMLRLENTILAEKQLREIELDVLSYTALEDEVEEAESREVSLNHLMVRNQYQEMVREQSSEAVDEQTDESMDSMVRSILREKEHPVFEEHPGADPGNNKVKKEDASPPDNSHDDREQPPEQQKEHPVFEEHPGDINPRNNVGNGPGDHQNNQHETQENKSGNGSR